MATVDRPGAPDEALSLIIETIENPDLEDRFPDAASFVASDDPNFSEIVAEAAAEGPIVVVFPGRQFLVVQGKRSGQPLAGQLHLA